MNDRLLSPSMERWLRIAALLIFTGLLIELATVFWSHPTSFLVFLTVGGSLIVLGVVLYLFSLLRWLVPRQR